MIIKYNIFICWAEFRCPPFPFQLFFPSFLLFLPFSVPFSSFLLPSFLSPFPTPSLPPFFLSIHPFIFAKSVPCCWLSWAHVLHPSLSLWPWQEWEELAEGSVNVLPTGPHCLLVWLRGWPQLLSLALTDPIGPETYGLSRPSLKLPGCLLAVAFLWILWIFNLPRLNCWNQQSLTRISKAAAVYYLLTSEFTNILRCREICCILCNHSGNAEVAQKWDVTDL